MSMWAIDDAVTSLRIKGGDRRYKFGPHRGAIIVGSSTLCDFVVGTPIDGIAARHAAIIPEGAAWSLAAIGEHSVLRDGMVTKVFPIVPGDEITVGMVTLIAESARLRNLRELLVDIIGARPIDADEALRTLRRFATDLVPLVLVGDDLPTTAYWIHRTLFGQSPFVLCDTRFNRVNKRAKRARSAVAAAVPGATACFLVDNLPDDFDRMLALRRESFTWDVRIVLCTRELPHAAFAALDPVIVRPLAKRADALQRVVTRCVDEEALLRGADAGLVTDADREWLASGWNTWSEIESAVERLFLLRHVGSITYAAKELGITHVALSRWFERHDARMAIYHPTPGRSEKRSARARGPRRRKRGRRGVK